MTKECWSTECWSAVALQVEVDLTCVSRGKTEEEIHPQIAALSSIGWKQRCTWRYVIGVGVAGGMVIRGQRAGAKAREAGS